MFVSGMEPSRGDRENVSACLGSTARKLKSIAFMQSFEPGGLKSHTKMPISLLELGCI